MSRWLVVAVFLASVTVARADTVACKPAAPGSKLNVTFAADTSVTELIAWVVGFSCKNVVMDAEVKARVPRVTIAAPKPLTPKQALQLFVDAVEATGLTVKQKPDTIIISLGPTMSRDCASSGTAVADAPPASSEPDDLAALVDASIKKQSETSYEISAKLIDVLLANPMAISKGARVVPAVKDGKPDGFKLYAIRPSSIFAKLGLANGDTLRAINGLELTSADKALEVYTKLRESKTLTVSLTRRGKPLTLTYTIK